MITIRHTPADGTLIEGTSKGDGVYDIVRAYPHKFRYFPSLEMIGIQGSRDRAPQTHRINTAAEALRTAGFDVTIEIDASYRPTAEREQARTERSEERTERYDASAQRLAGQAAAKRAASDRVFDNIPLGQPMLVDHHSYNADRNRRERAVKNLHQSFDLADQAREKARKADAAADNLEHREAPRTTMRRLDTLRADLRGWQRTVADCEEGTEYYERCQREITRLQDEIGYWQTHLDTLAASGQFTAWTPADFTKGDYANINGYWREVKRVNKLSLTVQSDYSWTGTAKYDKVFGRRRDDIQHNTPTAAPTPVTEARIIERWLQLRNIYPRLGRYDTNTDSQHRAITKALTTVLDSPDLDETKLLELHAADPRPELELAQLCLAIYTENRKKDGHDDD